MKKILLTISFVAGLFGISVGVFASSLPDDVLGSKSGSAAPDRGGATQNCSELNGPNTQREMEQSSEKMLVYWLKKLATELKENVEDWNDENLRNEGIAEAVCNLHESAETSLENSGPVTYRDTPNRLRYLRLLSTILFYTGAISVDNPQCSLHCFIKSVVEAVADPSRPILLGKNDVLISDYSDLNAYKGDKYDVGDYGLEIGERRIHHVFSFVENLLEALPDIEIEKIKSKHHWTRRGPWFNLLELTLAKYMLTLQGVDNVIDELGKADARLDPNGEYRVQDRDSAQEEK